MKTVTLASPIKVWYKSLPGSKILWPIVDIALSKGSKVLPQKLLALVDSGASISILHPSVAEFLGFDFSKLGEPKTGGISVSGVYKSWILPSSVTIDIYGYQFDFKFSVIDNPNLIWGCILGEDSIFSVAKIDFQKFKNYFELRFRQDKN